MFKAFIQTIYLALFCALFTGSAFAAASEKRVALVIGNAAYAYITPLVKPTNDAQSVADALKRMGYEVVVGTNASKLELDRLAQQFREAAKGADVGFFYYSGHGFQTNRADQQHPINHIVPVDFKVDAVDPTLETLALDTVVETLKSEVRVGFIFMDACRNDPHLAAASERLAKNSKGVMLSRGFSPVNMVSVPVAAAKPVKLKGPTGLLIAYATDPGNVALEGVKGNLSPFTTALIKHLGTPGISVAEMMGRVSADVALETDGQQTPWNVSSLTAGAYRFLAEPRSETGSGNTSNSAVGRASNSGGGRAEPVAQRQPARRASSASAAAPRSSNLPPNVGAGVGAGF